MQDRKFEVIAFDIDGTLTLSKQPMTLAMGELLGTLLKKYKVAIISGAHFQQFQWQVLSNIKSEEEDLKSLYLLPASGTAMCRFEGGWVCESDEPLSDDEKRRIREAFASALIKADIPPPVEMYGEMVEDRVSQMNFSALGQEAPLELKEAWDPDNKKRLRISEVLRELLPEFSFTVGGTTSIEATRHGVNKAYGLKKLLTYLNVTPEKMFFVGDKLFPGGNDAAALTVGAECRQVSGPDETTQVIHSLL
jgi:phosphomannomutase